MKKIIVGIFGFALLFTAQNAFAANWNSDPSDCQNTVAIANFTSNTGYGSCWTSTSMSAEPGDTINVRIYYHNTSKTVAKNVRLAVTKSSNSSTSHNFTGRIMSDNGDLSGNVNLSVSSSQSISFVDARWFPNQSRTQVALPNGQSSSSVLSNGISIGDVAPGWSSQGTMVVVFKVSSTVAPQPCTINSFTANPTSITAGGSSTLSWNTSNCRDTSITPNIGNVNNSGSLSVTPASTTTYTLTAQGPTGSPQTRTVKVTVNQPVACSISNFTASPSTITKGSSSVLVWNTNNCDHVTISPNIRTLGKAGSMPVSPTSTTTYTLKAYNTSGVLSDTENVTVTVNVIPSQMTGNLTASQSSCVIASGNSTCAIPFSWTTQNPVATSAITHDGVTLATGNNGSKSFAISNGSQTYYLYNNGNPLDAETVSASCASGTNWNGSHCAPVIVNTCAINNFSANPTSITRGDLSTLTWDTSNCTSVSISNVGNVSSNGTRSVYPTNTTTYVLTAYGSSSTPVTSSVKVYVNQPAVCAINNFSANPTAITSGESSVLNWSTSDCTNVTISNLSYNVPTSGTQTVYPTISTLYVLTAYGSNGMTQTQSVRVSVNQQPDLCIVSDFSANPTSVTSGGLSTLSWITSNCTSVNISNIGNVSNTGTRAVYPTSTTTYTLTAYSATGSPQTRTATVYVNQQPETCSINNFTASDTSIEYGDSSVLNWSTSDCTNVTISGLGYNVPTSGTQAVWPSVTKTYVLNAYGDSGLSQTRSVTIYVNDDNDDDNNCRIDDFTASDTSIDDGDSTTLRWNTTDCDRVKISKIGDVNDDGSEKVYPSTDTTYILTAYNTDGSTETESLRINVDDNNNNDNNCYINSFTSNKIYINSGDGVTLRWSTTDCDDVNISGLGDVDDDGSEVVYPTSTRTYTLRAEGDNDDDSRSITINVNYTPVTPVYNVNVVTTVATNISQTSAQLNGLITSTAYDNSSVYFEYGTSVNLGTRTASRTTNGNTNFNEFVSGLSSNTIYYFQAVSEGSNGISRGAIQIFRTLKYTTGVVTPTPTRVIVQGTTVTSSSPIILRIENKYQTIGVGDIVDYTVYYKNISNSTLTNPMVQVFIPQGITLINTSIGTYSDSDRTLSAPIADLQPGMEGVMYLQGRVDSLDINLAQIVTTAILVYTNPNGAQENAMAYVLNNPRIANLLGASAFFGSISGMSLIGLLFLAILIMLIVLIARAITNRRGDTIIHNH